MQWEPREWEIRFSSAFNAFRSYWEMVGGNGCRPSFSEFLTPSVAHPGGIQVLTDLLLVETRGAKLDPSPSDEANSQLSRNNRLGTLSSGPLSNAG